MDRRGRAGERNLTVATSSLTIPLAAATANAGAFSPDFPSHPVIRTTAESLAENLTHEASSCLHCTYRVFRVLSGPARVVRIRRSAQAEPVPQILGTQI